MLVPVKKSEMRAPEPDKCSCYDNVPIKDNLTLPSHQRQTDQSYLGDRRKRVEIHA